jgi:stage III sporulation protein AC
LEEQALFDYSTIFQIAGIGIFIGMIHTLLKQSGQEDFAKWISLIGFIFVLVQIATLLDSLFTKIKSVFLFYG